MWLYRNNEPYTDPAGHDCKNNQTTPFQSGDHLPANTEILASAQVYKLWHTEQFDIQ